MKSDPNTQRVNAAVGVAVRRAISEMPSIGNRQALEVSIGRRLQGTYGAELRRLADNDPALSIAELAEAVIFPGEYPADAVELASVHSGDRDRARKGRPSAPSPDDLWRAGFSEGWDEGIAAAKAAVAEPVHVQHEAPEIVPMPQIADMRAALTAGVVGFQQGRRARLEATRAKEAS